MMSRSIHKWTFDVSCRSSLASCGKWNSARMQVPAQNLWGVQMMPRPLAQYIRVSGIIRQTAFGLGCQAADRLRISANCAAQGLHLTPRLLDVMQCVLVLVMLEYGLEYMLHFWCMRGRVVHLTHATFV